MLVERVIGAFTFRQGVYEEVEHDTTFTATAWLIVAIASFLNNLGTGSADNVFRLIIGAAVGTVFALIAFAVATFVISWLGKALFSADVSFDEMVRVLGLASVWNAVGVLGIVSLISDLLSCAVAPVTIGAALLGLVAWFVAAREALDLDWGPTIVTVIVGWVVLLGITVVSGIILGIFGLGAYAVGSLLGL
jgi:hypothetical protein